MMTKNDNEKTRMLGGSEFQRWNYAASKPVWTWGANNRLVSEEHTVYKMCSNVVITKVVATRSDFLARGSYRGLGVFLAEGKTPHPRKSKRRSMHIPFDFLGRSFWTSEGSATSDNTSDEKIAACSHGIRRQRSYAGWGVKRSLHLTQRTQRIRSATDVTVVTQLT